MESISLNKFYRYRVIGFYENILMMHAGEFDPFTHKYMYMVTHRIAWRAPLPQMNHISHLANYNQRNFQYIVVMYRPTKFIVI